MTIFIRIRILQVVDLVLSHVIDRDGYLDQTQVKDRFESTGPDRHSFKTIPPSQLTSKTKAQR